MKIARIETFATQSVCVVRVTTDDGLAGFGQTAPFNADITAQVLHRQLAPLVLRRDPEEVEAIAETCISESYKFTGTYVCRALAGIDTALWDLRGKRAGRPVVELLGGTARPVLVYGSSMRRDITPADEAVRLKRRMDEEGFRAFKLKIGKRMGGDQDQWQGRTEEHVRTFRRELGSKPLLYVDANGAYSAARAIEVGRLLEQVGVSHYEEPCPFWELEWMAEVAAALDIPVAGGEQDFWMPQWRRIFSLEAVDIAQPDLCYVGGLTRALEVARMAAREGMPCTPHCANHSMIAVFTTHFMAAVPNAGAFMEYSVEDNTWCSDLYSPSLSVHDGAVQVPSGPGWGVTVSEEWLESATYQVSE